MFKEGDRRQESGVRILLAAGLLLCPLALRAQSPPDLNQILARLDKLEQENHELTEEVRALRARLDGAPSAAPANPQADLDERLAIQEQRTAELAQTKVESSQKFPVRLTGMALFNSFMNSRQSGGQEYPVVASAPGQAFSGATVRQTILGLDFRGPEAIAGGKVTGSVYMDFFGTSAGTISANVVRLRTAEIEVDWKTRSIMAGIEKPIFNPREPNSLAQVAVSPLTGAGNLWLWMPQVRFEQDFLLASATGVRAQAGVVQTREVNPYPGSSFAGPLAPARPGLEGRFEFFHNFDEERRFEIASGFHTSDTHAGGASIPSNLVSLDWFFNPLRRLEFTGAFFTGKNVAPLGNGFAQGFTIYGNDAEAIPSRGGWGQATIHAAPRLDFHFFTGRQGNDTGDLPSGLIASNLLFGGNLYYHLAPNVIVAVEATQTRTNYVRAYLPGPVRINNHYDVALAYLF